ncbi:MarR family winged helix-turn-helix transcriptional regulator [Roseibium sediminicola]|uniref:MarR family transcriptional regulator n=1 Tax=Roseibium sediminicola TaxID=2933272 RepID=A0ABT0H1A1_9HYPH|nr:MarR family transcriptional regulator [Roseibium sp. CAU 1639]MCK7615474.1 MarR family transcriptional regulator [Roseibium sp. CAU 1639]
MSNPTDRPGKSAPGANTATGHHEDLDDFLCFAVYEANLAFNQLYRSLLDDLGLTYPQYLVMTLLWRRDVRAVKEIGDALSLEYNTVTPLIKRLEAMDLVSRVRDLEDQRVVKVSLTAGGKALEKQARHIPQCVADASGLSMKAFTELKSSLEDLRNNLKSREEPS